MEEFKINYLREAWEALFAQLNVKEEIAIELWQELYGYYSESHRAYHNLNHLYDLFLKLEKQEAHDPSSVSLAIWYHDIIYRPLNKKNEEESAKLCDEKLSAIGTDQALRQKVFKLILSTKGHDTVQWSTNEERTDNDLLLDLDLSILGSPPEIYQQYTRQIRKEYQVVPGLLYRQGRKKVLRSFLNKAHIFKSPAFIALYEQQARENLSRELEELINA